MLPSPASDPAARASAIPGLVLVLAASATLGCGSTSAPSERLEPSRPPQAASGPGDVSESPPPEPASRPHEYVLLPYRGRFAADPRFPALVAELHRLLPHAMAEVGARLGLDLHRMPPVQFQFRDGTSTLTRDLGHGWTSIEKSGAVPAPVVALRTEVFVNGERDLGHLVRHELAHCFQLTAYTNFDEVPKWVTEGLAEWGTGTGRDNLIAGYLDYWQGRRVGPQGSRFEGLDRTLGPEGGRWNHYAESYLAFAMIEEYFGPDAVRTFSRALAEKPGVGRAIGLATGMTEEEFYREARRWSSARVRADLVDSVDHEKARDLLDQRRYADAIVALGAFLDRHPESLLRPLALTERVVARLHCGDIEGAERDLAESEAAARPVGALARTHRWLEIALMAERGLWTDVEREARLYLFDYDTVQGYHTEEVYVLLRQAQDEIKTGTHRE